MRTRALHPFEFPPVITDKNAHSSTPLVYCRVTIPAMQFTKILQKGVFIQCSCAVPGHFDQIDLSIKLTIASSN